MKARRNYTNQLYGHKRDGYVRVQRPSVARVTEGRKVEPGSGEEATGCVGVAVARVRGFRHPNGDYQTVNKIQVFGPPRAIGWLTGQEKGGGQLELGG